MARPFPPAEQPATHPEYGRPDSNGDPLRRQRRSEAGRSPGYAVVHLGVKYNVYRLIQLSLQVNNLLDRRYYSGSQLGPTGFTGAGNFIARPFPAAANGEFPVRQATFYAPGAPRGAWAGLRFRF